MLPLRLTLSVPLLLVVSGPPAYAQETATTRTVRARVQPRPGAAEAEVDMPVHAVPVDPPVVAADRAGLSEDELVLGIAHDGEALAIPIATLARFEVLNCRVAKLPVAPTW